MSRRRGRGGDVFIKDDLSSVADEMPSFEIVEPGTYAFKIKKAVQGQSRAQKPKIQMTLEVMEVYKGDMDAVGQTAPLSLSLSAEEFPSVQRKIFLRACGVKYQKKRGGWSLRDLEDAMFIADVGVRTWEDRDVNDVLNFRPYEEDFELEDEEGEESDEEEDEDEEEEEELPDDEDEEEEEEEEEDEDEEEDEEEEEEEEEVDRKPRKRQTRKSKKKGSRKSPKKKPKKKAKKPKKKSKAKGKKRGKRRPVR